MPDLGRKLHDWRLERVFIWNFDGDFICTTLIRSPRWTFEGTSQICNAITNRICKNLRCRVCSDVCQVLGYSPRLVASHFGELDVDTVRARRSEDRCRDREQEPVWEPLRVTEEGQARLRNS
jgi:hypothetical protein